MAMPSSPAGSDRFSPSSPADLDKSFMTHVTANMTEDEDHKPHAGRQQDTPELAERHAGRGRGRHRDSSAAGANPLFKDPSAIGKIRHLKKEDGEPLWRYDIQYDFLRAVFDDDHRVFTNSYEPEAVGRQCFADLYIDTMSRSSKTSKILHDKLLSDRSAAINMAMVCLLVNIGRMNTTLNFFPEMRAQLRTYHAIPSLQLHQDAHAYKQLQDAPRLKSILKGGCEDRSEPRSLDAVKERDVPRTNPVNLMFLICQSAAKVAELHFPPGREFHDLIMKTNLSSASRARAFLWIMWFYLESDFTEEGCDENPFGAGVDYGVDVANQGVPVLEELSPEEERRENLDTPEEREFGIQKKNLRSSILRDEQQLFTDSPPVKRSSRTTARPSVGAQATKESSVATEAERPNPPLILPRIRPSKHDSDVDSTRSTPPRTLARAMSTTGTGPGAGSVPRRAGTLKYQSVDIASPARQPPLLQQLHQQLQLQQLRKRGGRLSQKPLRHADPDDDDDDGSHTPAPTGGRKPRPPTAHQIAVENNRKQRIEYLLSRGMQRKYHRSRKSRRTDGAIVRALHRLEKTTDPFEDSESEDNVAWNRDLFPAQPGAAQKKFTGTAFRERGFAGLVLLNDEADDFGEEVSAYAAAVRQSCRRMNRWAEGKSMTVVAPTKRPRVNVVPDEYRDPNETEEEDMDDQPDMSLLDVPVPSSAKRRRTAGGVAGTPSGRGRGGKAPTAKTAAGAVGAAGAAARRRRRIGDATAAGSIANGDGAADDDVDADADADLDADGEAMDVDGEADDVAEARLAKDEDDNEEDELNDVDKTLLGMGDGDSESE